MAEMWTEVDCLRLIEMYRGFDALWDSKHAGHFKSSQKEAAWNEIGAALRRPVSQIKNKMLSLLASYRRERSKTIKGNGKDPSEPYTSKWFAYEAMSFLENRSKRRVSTEYLEDPNVDEEISYEGEVSAPVEIRFEQLTTPPTYKRIKREEPEREENPAVPLQMNLFTNNDEQVTAFLNYVSTKVRNYSMRTWRGVEKDIFEILVKADRGHYESVD